ncbi:MAG: HAD-IIIA family hydrolase [Planctomycetes bacterium]|nr:HAD-IIIA family hydrolase [Planctomycetota bacterium]
MPTSPWSRIRLLALDVDGVLTDGRITVDARGRETKSFHAHDGQGIVLLGEAGVRVAIVSGRKSGANSWRARDLGIRDIIQNCPDKAVAMRALSRKHGVMRDSICFVGDDLPDLAAFSAAGLPVAVANARPEVRRAARYVTRAPGGHGAVREVCDRILAARHGRRN